MTLQGWKMHAILALQISTTFSFKDLISRNTNCICFCRACSCSVLLPYLKTYSFCWFQRQVGSYVPHQTTPGFPSVIWWGCPKNILQNRKVNVTKNYLTKHKIYYLLDFFKKTIISAVQLDPYISCYNMKMENLTTFYYWAAVVVFPLFF